MDAEDLKIPLLFAHDSISHKYFSHLSIHWTQRETFQIEQYRTQKIFVTVNEIWNSFTITTDLQYLLYYWHEIRPPIIPI
jgi:hypothetical protein